MAEIPAHIPLSEDTPLHSVIHVFEPSPSTEKAGRIIIEGLIEGGRGIVPALPFRVYGSYAIVYITAGRGRYRDANGYEQEVVAGDVIYVLPELSHTYGPDPGTTWDEYYIVFDGPAAAAMREWGVISARRPIAHIEPVAKWTDRLRAVTAGGASDAGSGSSIYRLVALLGEVDAAASVAAKADDTNAAIAACCRLLSTDLAGEKTVAEIADMVGVAHSTLRRLFRAEMGLSMQEFRARRRIEAARDLLRYTSMTNAQIAARLGFADEYHFSKQYKLRNGAPPKATRDAVRGHN